MLLPPWFIEFATTHQNLLWFATITADLSITLLLYRLFGKTGLYTSVILGIMLSNLQGPKLTMVFGMHTSLGTIIYSGIYFATDLLSERYGRQEAQRAVLLGFATSVILVVVMSVSLLFVPSVAARSVHDAMVLIFGFTPRFVFGSLFAYLISQSFDVWVFHYLKRKTKGRHLWLRNNVSTLVSQAIDTVLYSLVVWWGVVQLKMAIHLGLAKYLFKFVIALFDTPFIYWARSWDVTNQDWYEPFKKDYRKDF
jgi:queuosine precursor transporter